MTKRKENPDPVAVALRSKRNSKPDTWTPEHREQARAAIQKINAAKPPPKKCNCSAGDANTNYRDHHKTCPVRTRLQRQEYRRKKKEKENTDNGC